uniref:Uncharacterized protein n=1 Tax=Anguilla anguilla TaxID=7936 RepID=A0A0E9U3C7_ANGAN
MKLQIMYVNENYLVNVFMLITRVSCRSVLIGPTDSYFVLFFFK